MSDPFIGEIRAFGFHFAPINWAFCNGQVMSISQNAALFSILGTTFGGDGVNTFNLPNLQERAPMHWGNGAGLTPHVLGETTGASTETLTINEMPAHSHSVQTTAGGTLSQEQTSPGAAAFLGISGAGGKAYNNTAVAFDAPFSPKAVGNNGGSQPHQNLQPLLAHNFCIAVNGIYPTRN